VVLSPQSDDALLEQKIAAVLQKILQKEADSLFAEKIAAFVKENEQRARELFLMDRIVRVEEDLKSLQEIEAARFEAAARRFKTMEKRFEVLQRGMVDRFEARDQ